MKLCSLIPRLATALLMLLALGVPAQAANTPQWTLTVPATSSFSSNSSDLVYAGSDSLGNTFLIVQHYNLVVNFPNSSTTPVGFQIFLVNSKGKQIASGEVLASTLSPVLVTAKRMLCIKERTQLTEFKVAGSTFTQTALQFGGAYEIPLDSSRPLASTVYGLGIGGYTEIPGFAFWSPGLNRLIDKGRLYTADHTATSGLVTTVKRYVVAALKP